MAIVNKKFTLILNNICTSDTYATIYFRLNGGVEKNMSKNVTALSSASFEQNYTVDTDSENTLFVSGDIVREFILT
jgi:hypothetical protein